MWKYTVDSTVSPRYSSIQDLSCQEAQKLIMKSKLRKKKTLWLSVESLKNIPSKNYLITFINENINKPPTVMGKVTDNCRTRYRMKITFVPIYSNHNPGDVFKEKLNSKLSGF